MIKLVAFDLDGTVVDHENKPTPSTLTTIRTLIDEGIHVASISGRSISKSQFPFEQHTDYAEMLSVGSYNGAVALDRVRDGRRRSLHEQRMPEETFREIVGDLCEAGINYIYCHLRLNEAGVEVEDYMTLRQDKTIHDMTVQVGVQFVLDPDLTDKITSGALGIPPKILICPGSERREEVYGDLKARYDNLLYIERTDIDRVEAMHPEVNKARALRSICDACGVDVSEAMAIGDGSNDLPMLEAAGVGVLLGNADEKTKQAGKGVVHGASFSDNGFTDAVNRYVLN